MYLRTYLFTRGEPENRMPLAANHHHRHIKPFYNTTTSYMAKLLHTPTHKIYAKLTRITDQLCDDTTGTTRVRVIHNTKL